MAISFYKPKKNNFSADPNYFIVWDVVKNKIPELHNQIVHVLENQ
jgi:uncharacterized protein with HEPN domain